MFGREMLTLKSDALQTENSLRMKIYHIKQIYLTKTERLLNSVRPAEIACADSTRVLKWFLCFCIVNVAVLCLTK